MKPKKSTDVEREAKWWRENFPTAKAREAADRAVDALPPSATMAQHTDTWLAAYDAADGLRPVFDD